MLVHTGRQGDHIKALAFPKPPNPVRAIPLMVILPDPRAYPDILSPCKVMKFQSSPFLRVDQAVSNIEECPGPFLFLRCASGFDG